MVVRTQTETAASPGEVALIFLRLGCMSFGGPIAHLSYFQRELVERRGWCSQSVFAEIVALAQVLPGPSSSQVGMALGIVRAGWLGGFAAWVGFTLPSAMLMLALAFGHPFAAAGYGSDIAHGLQLAAVAVVAHAIVTMQRSLAPDGARILLAVGAAAVTLLAPAFAGSAFAIVLGALAGLLCFAPKERILEADRAPLLPRSVALFAAFLFVLLLVFSLLQSGMKAPGLAAILAAFYRSGALVFGGGHVVLPLLQQTVVQPGWVTQTTFLSGYGAAQMLPGPLFSIAAYLGASIEPAPNRLVYGLVALVAIFLPGMLAMAAALPFWGRLGDNRRVGAALAGVNASVVGVLLAAWIRPLAVTTLRSPADIGIALVSFGLLWWLRLPSWAVVAFSVAAYLVTAAFLRR